MAAHLAQLAPTLTSVGEAATAEPLAGLACFLVVLYHDGPRLQEQVDALAAMYLIHAIASGQHKRSLPVCAAALISCFPDGQLTELHRGSAAQHLLVSHPDAEQYVVDAPVILAMPAPQVIDSHVARPVQQRLLVHPRAAQKIDPALGFIVIGAAPMWT